MIKRKIDVRVDLWQWQALQSLASKYGVGYGEVLRVLLSAELARRGFKPPKRLV